MQALVVAIFAELTKQLITWGYLKAEDGVYILKRLEDAKKYKKVVDNPNSSREERRKAEDEMFG